VLTGPTKTIRAAVRTRHGQQQAEQCRAGQQCRCQGRRGGHAGQQGSDQDPPARKTVACQAVGQRDQQGYRALAGQDKPELAGRPGDPQDRETQHHRQETVRRTRHDQCQQDTADAAIRHQATARHTPASADPGSSALSAGNLA
jgi:hypothetical protein